ncbi:MAG: NAD(P)/FAD-dependent oxidoreductase [Deltaproteobacteria bacterium]|nr:NAD(P)/FAD-dependent oxidoreductase [Deltaproteobacteria bacterium]
MSSPSETEPKPREPELPISVDVAVVGSGLGGLVSAAYLARRGLRVAVFESHYVAGGCATQFERGARGARYRFDVGLHYVGDCAPGGMMPRILDDLGIRVDFLPMDQDGFDELVFPDFRFRIPADLELYRQRLVQQFPAERRGIERYIGLVGSILRLSRAMDRKPGTMPPLTDLPRLALDALRFAPHREATIGDVLAGITRDPRLRAVLCGQHGDYGLAPSKVSAALHLGLAAHYFRGAYYPKGGGQVIADRLVDALEAHGATVHVRAPVERILVEGGRATGVVIKRPRGERHEVRARIVLSNADLKRTYLELVGPEHLPLGLIERTRRYAMATPLFMTFLGVRGDLRDLGMRVANYWQMDGYDVEDVYRQHADPADAIRGCYVTSGSLKDPESALHHAPSGESTLEVMALVPGPLSAWGVDERGVEAWRYRREAAYTARKDAIEANLLARLERLFPGVGARVTYRESATPVTHLRFTGATGGTGYGIAATPEQFMGHRPGYRGPIPGLYLAGASTRSGHGIVGAMLSGRAASARVLMDEAGGR